MNNLGTEKEYSVSSKRKILQSSIRKSQMEQYFQKKRNNLLNASKDELVISQIRSQIKNKKEYFNDLSKPLSHLKIILDILHSNEETTALIIALTCICEILKKNQKVFYETIISIDPEFLQFLRGILISGSVRVKLKALNILNWLAGEYKQQTLKNLWNLGFLDILNDFIQKYPDLMIMRISINFVGNMVTYENSINIVEHRVLNNIICLTKNQHYDIRLEAYSCLETVLYHLSPEEVNNLHKKYKIIGSICFQLDNAEYGTAELSIIGLKIIKRYIQVNNNRNNDFNRAIDELQRIYDFGRIMEKISISFNAASRGPMLQILEMADEMLDILGQCVNNDDL